MLNLTNEQAERLNQEIHNQLIERRQLVKSLLQENEEFLNQNAGKNYGTWLLEMFQLSSLYSLNVYRLTVELYQLFFKRIEITVLEEVLDECYDLMLENLNNGVQMEEVLNLLLCSPIGKMIAERYEPELAEETEE